MKVDHNEYLRLIGFHLVNQYDDETINAGVMTTQHWYHGTEQYILYVHLYHELEDHNYCTITRAGKEHADKPTQRLLFKFLDTELRARGFNHYLTPGEWKRFVNGELTITYQLTEEQESTLAGLGFKKTTTRVP
ncbi:hypothetical protein CEW46_31015, partial [Bacillus cereus]